MKDRDLLQAELSVAACDGLSVVVAQGVQHGVVRVDAGKTVLFQLVRD